MSDQFTPPSEPNDSSNSLRINSSPSSIALEQYIFSILPSQVTVADSVPLNSTIASNGEISIVDKFKEKLTIKVVKSGKFYDSTNCKVPTYKTSSENRGKMLLINNIKFADGNGVRKHSELDETNIKELFKQMGFDIVSYQDLDEMNMKAKIKSFRNDESLKSVDIGVVIVMSHGTGTWMSHVPWINNGTKVQCADGEIIDTKWIIDQFDSLQCPALANKPKIFIFQCCRGATIDAVRRAIKIVREEPEKEYARVAPDMLITYSNVPSFVAYHGIVKGSWYIQAICRVFMDHAHDTDVESMLKMVYHELSALRFKTRQTSSFENRGFKTCYLHPM